MKIRILFVSVMFLLMLSMTVKGDVTIAVSNAPEDVADTYIAEAYSWFPEATGTEASLRTCPGGWQYATRHLIRFDALMDSLPAWLTAADITQVRLGLYRHDTAGNTVPYSKVVAAAAFSEDTTYAEADPDNQRRASYITSGFEQMPMDGAVGWKWADVTDLVKGWVSGSEVNNGFMIANYADGTWVTPGPMLYSSDHAAVDFRPRLEVAIPALIPSDCAQAIEYGYELAGDLDHNCYVNLADFALMTHDWMRCIDPNAAGCEMPWADTTVIYVPNSAADVADTFIREVNTWIPEADGTETSLRHVQGGWQYGSSYLIRFDELISSLPAWATANDITQVRLGLYRHDNNGISLSDSKVIAAAAFTEDTTYAAADPANQTRWSYITSSFSSMPMDAVVGWKWADVTDLVKSWVGGSATNNGFLVVNYCDGNWKITDVYSSDYTDAAYRPKLEITLGGGPSPTVCSEAIEYGYVLTGDRNSDCRASMVDLAMTAEDWLSTNDPADPCCTANWMDGVRQFSIAAGSATVDGDLSEWADADWITMDQVYYYYGVGDDPCDLSEARWAARWDDAENVIYIAVTGVDVDQVFNPFHFGWNQQDAVEFYIDADPNNNVNYSADFGHAQQYVGGAADATSGVEWITLGAGNAIPVGVLGGFEAAVSGSTISYEVAFRPYKYLDLNLADPSTSVEVDLDAGMPIRLDVVMCTKNARGDFGMLCENTMTQKSMMPANFQRYVLVSNP